MIAGRFETEIVGDELQSRSIEIAGRIIREAIACKNRQTHRHSQGRPEPRHPRQQKITHARASLKARKNKKTAQRSEEHTSELQSLMRNSYAVFCLKKKTKKKH